jgi:hypothetical protein
LSASLHFLSDSSDDNFEEYSFATAPSSLLLSRDRLLCNAACFEMAASDSILISYLASARAAYAPDRLAG